MVEHIIWTLKAKQNLRDIYDYYRLRSEQGAKNVRRDILNKVKSIRYPAQYQVDEIDSKYRRMVVRHYKILYSYKDSTVYIHRIFDARQNPNKLLDEDFI